MTVPKNLTFFPPPSSPSLCHKEVIYDIALTSTHLITCSQDKTLRIWSLSTHLPIHSSPLTGGHTGSILCVAVLETEGLVVAGSADASLCCWDIESGVLVKRIEHAHTESVLSVLVSADGKWVVTGGKDRVVKVWERGVLGFVRPSEAQAQSHSQLQPQPTAILSEGITAAVNAVAISSSHIISGSGDRGIKIWNLGAPWACVKTIRVHEKGVASLVLSQDGTKLVSGSSDQTMRVFDLETGAEELCFRDHDNLVRRVCVPPNVNVEGGGNGGLKCIVSGSYDEHVVVRRRDAGVEGGWAVHKVHIGEMAKQFWERCDAGEERWEERAFNWIGGLKRVFSVKSDGKRVFVSAQMGFVVSFDLDA
ncbi:WD40-repeat-containing domain protein [Clohesyomyces aquaticus]|uniref:WD40-repeat-containing domain protein n=1 Tax=Clohesyomyces aquaticus TaxID=1231657 RepID=A0A1Y1ZR45_9PLEO|nr:WD40-repeat-containing domain protein [Clohesyomyces aquaticus]